MDKFSKGSYNDQHGGHSHTERDAISDLRVVDTCERARDPFPIKKDPEDYLNDQHRGCSPTESDVISR